MTDHTTLLTEIFLGLPGRIYRSPMPFSPYDRLGEVWQLYWQNKIKTVVINKADLRKLDKYRSLRVGNFRINVSDDFDVPQVKVYGRLRGDRF